VISHTCQFSLLSDLIFLFSLRQLSWICQPFSYISYKNKAHAAKGITELEAHSWDNQADPALEEVSAQQSKTFARMLYHKAAQRTPAFITAAKLLESHVSRQLKKSLRYLHN